MQTEDNARIARLEELLDEMQRENTELRADLEGLRLALRGVTSETFGVLEAIGRQTEAAKNRLERALGRPFTDKKLIDLLVRDTATS
jgi:hypothetical protein